MILKIDTIKPDNIQVEIFNKDRKIIDRLVAKQKTGSQVLLPLISKILKKNGKKLQDLKSIEVNIGPGSFTGTRVGVAVANALGFALNIPVNASPREAGKKGKIALPVYEKSKFG